MASYMKQALKLLAVTVLFCTAGLAFCPSPILIPASISKVYSNSNRQHDDTGELQFNDRNSKQSKKLNGIIGSVKSWGQRWRQDAKKIKFRSVSTEKKEEADVRDIETALSVSKQQTFEGNSSLTLNIELPSWLLPLIIVREKAKHKRNQFLSSSKSLFGKLNMFSKNERRSNDGSDDEDESSYWGYGWPSSGTQSRLGGSWQVAEDSLRVLSPEGMSLAALSSSQTPQTFTPTAQAPLMKVEESTETLRHDDAVLQEHRAEGISTDTPPLVSPNPPLSSSSPPSSSSLPMNRSHTTRTGRIREVASSVAGGAWRGLLRQSFRWRNSSMSPAVTAAKASELLAAYAISPAHSAKLADLSDVVYLPDLHEALKARGLAIVANGTSRDLRWVVVDGVNAKGKLERSVVMSGARFMPDYSDPLLDIGRLLAALGQCQPTPLLNSTLSMTPELAPVQVPKVSKRISISRKEKRTAGANASTSYSNMTSYNDSCVLFHGGLLRVAQDLLDELTPYFDTCPPSAEIRLIGHSLGGSASIILRALLAARLGYTPDAATAGIRSRLQVYAFGSVPVVRFRVPPTSSTTPDADIRAELFFLGLSSRDCHEFAMPWDPIPRMLSDDDFMGAWLRNRPYTAKRIEQRAAMFQALFRGGWISANASDSTKSEIDLNSASDSTMDVLNASGVASSIIDANTTTEDMKKQGTDEIEDVAVNLSPVPEELGSSNVSDILGPHAQSFEHVGTMHVILPGSRRMSRGGRLLSRGAPKVFHLPASDATRALKTVLPGDQVTGGIFGLTPRSFLKAYWAHFAYAKELASASDTTAFANLDPVSWEEVFGSLNQGSPENKAWSEKVAIQESKNMGENK